MCGGLASRFRLWISHPLPSTSSESPSWRVSEKLSDCAALSSVDIVTSLSVVPKANWAPPVSPVLKHQSGQCRGSNPWLGITSNGLEGEQGFVHHSRSKQTGKGEGGGGIKMKRTGRFISTVVRIKGPPLPCRHHQPTACMVCFSSF